MKHISVFFLFLSLLNLSRAEEFATNRFGDASVGYNFERMKGYYKNGDLGRAVLEIEPLLEDGAGNPYAQVKQYLLTEPELAHAVFRATESSGIAYYSCVFGPKIAKQLLMSRLTHYGGSLQISVREERTQLVANIRESDEDKINTSLDCTNFRKNFTSVWTEEVDSLYLSNERAIQTAQLQYEEKENKYKIAAAQNAETTKREREEALHQINKRKLEILTRLKPYSIAIGKPSVFDYSTATGLRFSILNLSKKPIKYVNLTLVGINAVGDTVIDRMKGKTLSFKAIGPIEKNERASYSEDVMWFTTIVQRVRIDSIGIVYMDGSTITIKNPMKVVVAEDELDIISSSE